MRLQKSKPFSNTLLSFSLKTLLLKLQTVSEQKCPCNLSSLVPVVLTSLMHGSCFCNSSKISRNSLSCVDSKNKLLHLQADQFSGDDVIGQSAFGEVDIPEEFLEFSKSFLIASKLMTFSPELLKF